MSTRDLHRSWTPASIAAYLSPIIILFVFLALLMAAVGYGDYNNKMSLAEVAELNQSWNIGDVTCKIGGKDLKIAAISPAGEVAIAMIDGEIIKIEFVAIKESWDKIQCKAQHNLGPRN